MKSVIPYIWSNNNAEEMVSYYTKLFPDSKVGQKLYYGKASSEVSGMPVGAVMTIQFWLCGQEFVALNGGDFFQLTPAISMTVQCETQEQVNNLWENIKESGKEMMPLQEYPFSKLYGWVEDKFGMSWQIHWNEKQQKVIPSLLFVGEHFGKAGEAAEEYVRIFKDQGKIISMDPYSESGPDPKGTSTYCLIELAGQEFILMDGAGVHDFNFTGGISFLIDCEDQSEIDYFWKQITSEGHELPCGWASDKYGVHWQIFAKFLEKYLYASDKEKSERALKAMYGMKKIIIEDIVNA